MLVVRVRQVVRPDQRFAAGHLGVVEGRPHRLDQARS
jgi:hypothetical protein